jgi:protein-S-isoprenylcysteine O-methyltransferase Ste14
MLGMYLVSDAEFTFEIIRTLNFKLFVLAVLLGVAILLGSWLSLLGVVVLVLFIERFQIKSEEAVLMECFGEQFIQYKTSVRRWL